MYDHLVSVISRILQILHTDKVTSVVFNKETCHAGVWDVEVKFHYSFSQHYKVKSKAVPLHAMEELGGRGGIAPTHSRPRH
jgi:hypothetical protein